MRPSYLLNTLCALSPRDTFTKIIVIPTSMFFKSLEVSCSIMFIPTMS